MFLWPEITKLCRSWGKNWRWRDFLAAHTSIYPHVYPLYAPMYTLFMYTCIHCFYPLYIVICTTFIPLYVRSSFQPIRINYPIYTLSILAYTRVYFKNIIRLHLKICLIFPTSRYLHTLCIRRYMTENSSPCYTMQFCDYTTLRCLYPPYVSPKSVFCLIRPHSISIELVKNFQVIMDEWS